MSCRDLRELISPYLDEALEADEARRVEAHLESCASCREHADALQALQGRLAALPRRVETNREELLRAAMGRHGRRWGARRRQLVVAAVAASVVLVSALVLLRSVDDEGSRDGERQPRALPAGGPDLGHSARHETRLQRSHNPLTLLLAGASGKGRGRGLLRVRVVPGVVEHLTTPPAGAVDLAPVVSPDGLHVVFERRSAQGTTLRWRSTDLRGKASVPLRVGNEEMWAPRFLCDDRLRVVVDRVPAGQRTHLTARERDFTLASDGPTRPSDNGAPHLWRIPSSWSRDRCVTTRLKEAWAPQGKRARKLLTFEVTSCRGGRDNAGHFRKPYTELVRWPLSIGNNLRFAQVSPDGRHVAVVLDRDRVRRSRPPGPGWRAGETKAGLLYLVTLHDGAVAKYSPAQPPNPAMLIEGGADPGALAMKAQSRFLLWRRLATEIVGRPRWSPDGQMLCFVRRERRHEKRPAKTAPTKKRLSKTATTKTSSAEGHSGWCFRTSTNSSRRLDNHPTLRFVVPGPRSHVALLRVRRAKTSGRPSARLKVLSLEPKLTVPLSIVGVRTATAPVWMPPKNHGSPCKSD